jgi:hypothetical protein
METDRPPIEQSTFRGRSLKQLANESRPSLGVLDPGEGLQRIENAHRILALLGDFLEGKNQLLGPRQASTPETWTQVLPGRIRLKISNRAECDLGLSGPSFGKRQQEFSTLRVQSV